MLVVTNVSYEPLYKVFLILYNVYFKKHYVNKYAKVLDKSIKVCYNTTIGHRSNLVSYNYINIITI